MKSPGCFPNLESGVGQSPNSVSSVDLGSLVLGFVMEGLQSVILVNMVF